MAGAASSKQTQLLNNLESFYSSQANFDFSPPSSPLKITPSTSDSEQDPPQIAVPTAEQAEIQRSVFAGLNTPNFNSNLLHT